MVMMIWVVVFVWGSIALNEFGFEDTLQISYCLRCVMIWDRNYYLIARTLLYSRQDDEKPLTSNLTSAHSPTLWIGLFRPSLGRQRRSKRGRRHTRRLKLFVQCKKDLLLYFKAWDNTTSQKIGRWKGGRVGVRVVDVDDDRIGKARVQMKSSTKSEALFSSIRIVICLLFIVFSSASTL